jgi:hypothetical protein
MVQQKHPPTMGWFGRMTFRLSPAFQATRFSQIWQ